MKNAISNILRHIKYLSFNSKDIKKNSMYFCLSGTKTNGVIYIDEAIQNGGNMDNLSIKTVYSFLDNKNNQFTHNN